MPSGEAVASADDPTGSPVEGAAEAGTAEVAESINAAANVNAIVNNSSTDSINSANDTSSTNPINASNINTTNADDIHTNNASATITKVNNGAGTGKGNSNVTANIMPIPQQNVIQGFIAMQQQLQGLRLHLNKASQDNQQRL